MTGDTKKTFIVSILNGLIEKTQEIEVMKAICTVRSKKIIFHELFYIFYLSKLSETLVVVIILEWS